MFYTATVSITLPDITGSSHVSWTLHSQQGELAGGLGLVHADHAAPPVRLPVAGGQDTDLSWSRGRDDMVWARRAVNVLPRLQHAFLLGEVYLWPCLLQLLLHHHLTHLSLSSVVLSKTFTAVKVPVQPKIWNKVKYLKKSEVTGWDSISPVCCPTPLCFVSQHCQVSDCLFSGSPDCP